MQILQMTVHPITGWSLISEPPHSFEREKAKKYWRKKDYKRKKTKEVKNETI
jgi:Zn-finger nucleic acid-binding protein